MSALIKKHKSPSETILTSRKDVFFSLCKSIIGQQISVAAANAVFLKSLLINQYLELAKYLVDYK